MDRPRRLLRVWAGLLLLAAGAIGLWQTRPHERAITLDDACHTPVLVIEPGSGRGDRVAVVFHGLAASEAIMQPLGQSLAAAGWRVYLLDLPGHGRSLERFSYGRVDRCAEGAVLYLERTGRLRPGRTVFVGHSLGGAAVLRLADTLPVAGTVAISPAPVVLPLRMPSNLLVLAGQFDLGPVKKMARLLLDVAGGTRTGREDFIQRRAVALHIIPGELHGSMVIDPRVWRLVDRWAGRAVGSWAGDVPPSAIRQPLLAMLAGLALLAGLVLLVAPGETVLARMFLVEAPAPAAPAPDFGARGALVRWAIASFTAVSLLGLLRLPEYVRPVRLEDGDWAALAALLTGVLLVALMRKTTARVLQFDPRGQALAAVAGIAVVVGFALALRPEFVEASFHLARLWRWAALVGFTWPYFLAEEAALGAPDGRKRFFLFLGLRALVWLAQLFALLVFWRWGLLLVLLGFGFGAVSIGQRFAADALRRRGVSPVAAALFDAILAAGMLAVVLPLA